MERDLFDAEHDGFLTDVNLLETLVTEKLQAEADKLKADGWSWVEVNRTEDRWRAVRTYQQLRPKSVSLSDELQEEADRLIKERATLQCKDQRHFFPGVSDLDPMTRVKMSDFRLGRGVGDV